MTAEDWRADALCAQVGGNFWFPEPSESAMPARAICARCPAQAPCLAYAMENRITEGFWGNTSPKQRQKLRRTA